MESVPVQLGVRDNGDRPGGDSHRRERGRHAARECGAGARAGNQGSHHRRRGSTGGHSLIAAQASRSTTCSSPISRSSGRSSPSSRWWRWSCSASSRCSSCRRTSFPTSSRRSSDVTITYPGASPETWSERSSKPVEERCRVDQRARWRQVARCFAIDGLAQFTLVLRLREADPAGVAGHARRDLGDARRSAARDEGADHHALRPTDRADRSLALIVDHALDAASSRGSPIPGLTRELRSIAGVAEVKVVGKVKRELTVQLDPRELQAAKASASRRWCRRSSCRTSRRRWAGSTARSTRRRSGCSGRLRTPQEFENLVVAERDGQVIRLGQVANVNDGTEEPRTLALFNGKRGGRHRHQEVEGLQHDAGEPCAIKRASAELQKTLPPGTKIDDREGRRRAREPCGEQRARRR